MLAGCVDSGIQFWTDKRPPVWVVQTIDVNVDIVVNHAVRVCFITQPPIPRRIPLRPVRGEGDDDIFGGFVAAKRKELIMNYGQIKGI